MHPRAYDQPASWDVRLRRVVRVLRIVRDLAHSLWLVAFGAIVGGIAGAMIGAQWNTAAAFWSGLVAGGSLGAIVAGLAARRILFGGPPPEEKSEPDGPEPTAPRWPGVEDQFRRILTRMYLLFAVIFPPFLFLAYLKLAPDAGWPVPSWPPEWVFVWGCVGIMLAAAAVLFLVIRCPQCRGVLWNAAKLYQCPHCGVVLRD